MRSRRCAKAGVAMPVALVLAGMAGCDAGAPPAGSRAVVAADYLDKQQAKVEQYRASLKARPPSRSTVRR